MLTIVSKSRSRFMELAKKPWRRNRARSSPQSITGHQLSTEKNGGRSGHNFPHGTSPGTDAEVPIFTQTSNGGPASQPITSDKTDLSPGVNTNRRLAEHNRYAWKLRIHYRRLYEHKMLDETMEISPRLATLGAWIYSAYPPHTVEFTDAGNRIAALFPQAEGVKNISLSARKYILAHSSMVDKSHVWSHSALSPTATDEGKITYHQWAAEISDHSMNWLTERNLFYDPQIVKFATEPEWVIVTPPPWYASHKK